MKDEMMDRITMTKPRLTALMRHLGLEFKEVECRACAGDGCLQDGGECPDCDHGSGARITCVPMKRPIPVVNSVKTYHIKGRGKIKEVVVDEALFNYIGGGYWQTTEAIIDGTRWKVTGVEATRNQVALGKHIGLIVRVPDDVVGEQMAASLAGHAWRDEDGEQRD